MRHATGELLAGLFLLLAKLIAQNLNLAVERLDFDQDITASSASSSG